MIIVCIRTDVASLCNHYLLQSNRYLLKAENFDVLKAAGLMRSSRTSTSDISSLQTLDFLPHFGVNGGLEGL